MNCKRVGSTGVFGVALLLLVAVEPAAAQTSSSTTESIIWNLNNKLIYVAVPITILVEGILIYTVWKFARSNESQPTQENRRLEITWTIATAIILLFVGIASYQVLGNPYVSASAQEQVEQPEQREEIQVYAFAYGWQFQYDQVDAEGVSAEGLTLESVTVSDATVVNSTEDGVVVEDARISGPEVENATLESGTVEGVEGQSGEQISAEDVTVADATISGATLSDASVQMSGTMVLPADRDVRLNITSRDLVHAFHVPALGLKKDALPEQSTYLQTRATETGEYQLYCAEYCGVGHSGMLGTVEVVPQDEYDQQLVDQWKEGNQ